MSARTRHLRLRLAGPKGILIVPAFTMVLACHGSPASARPEDRIVQDNAIALRPPASASPPVTAVVDLDIGPGESSGLTNPKYVLALDSGFLVVDNEGRSPLTFFGKRGALERQVGAFGSGPGDFSTVLSQAVDLGDQIMIPDYGNRRLVFLDATSKAWLRTVPFPSMPTMPFMWVSASPRRVASSVMEPTPADGAVVDIITRIDLIAYWNRPRGG